MPASQAHSISLPGSDHKGPAAIYVHWPFCEKKCPYCDFNSHVRENVDHARWREAFTAEIKHFAALYPNLTVGSVFFGGGTPSLMEPKTTETILETLDKTWGLSAGTEITLEANPSSVEAGRFRAYRDAGVNRLSVGIQSFSDEALQFLGRLHNAREAKEALDIARSTFNRVSFDLIYALPGQSVKDWEVALADALSLGTSHLSLYQLTIEEGTAFHHQYERGKFTLPDEDTAAALFETTQELTEKAGLPAYETSNHAEPGLESRHNMAYWIGDPYVGIGPGAHGRLPAHRGGATAHAQIKRPEDWLTAVEQFGIGLQETEDISATDRAVEAIMTGLRLKQGVNLADWHKKFGQPRASTIHEMNAHELKASGHIIYTDDTLCLTPKGQPLLNHIIGKLLA